MRCFLSLSSLFTLIRLVLSPLTCLQAPSPFTYTTYCSIQPDLHVCMDSTHLVNADLFLPPCPLPPVSCLLPCTHAAYSSLDRMLACPYFIRASGVLRHVPFLRHPSDQHASYKQKVESCQVSTLECTHSIFKTYSADAQDRGL